MCRVLLDFLRAAALAIALLGGTVGSANALVVSQTADPFPPNTVLTTGTQIWQSTDFQILNGIAGSLVVQSDQFTGGNETVVLDTVFTGVLVDTLHALSTNISLSGTIDIVINGRLSGGSTGSWTSRIQSLALSGNAFGSPVLITTVASAVSVSSVSAGTVSIADNGNGTYNVDDTFLYPAQISVAGGPAEPFLPLVMINAAATEPATLALLGLPVAGLLWVRRRKRH